MGKNKRKGSVFALLLGVFLFSGMVVTAKAEYTSFSEYFYLSSTGYTGNQTKVVDGGNGWINCSTMSGSSYFMTNLVNSNYETRSGVNKVNYTGSQFTIVNVYSSASAGYWYYYRMQVPNLGTTLKGTFSVG